jgi:Flp pilus assembly protein TadG
VRDRRIERLSVLINIRKRVQREDGAAAVEFALIVGVLAMLIFGMLQYGVAFFELQNLRAATREASRVGAVRGTGAEVKGQVAAVSGIPAATFGSSLTVYRQTTTGTYVAVADGDRPCVTTTGPTPQSVKTEINLASTSLPAGLQNIFTVDIPLLPTISLRSAKIFGEFRCET